jgi:hypothetical protein
MRSNLQAEITSIVKGAFPHYKIFEEYSLGEGLSLDIVIKFGNTLVGIEVQGEQHYRPVEFFHKDAEGWFNQQRNDRRKADLCCKKNIALVEIKYDEFVTEESVIDKVITAVVEFELQTVEDDAVAAKRKEYKEKRQRYINDRRKLWKKLQSHKNVEKNV